MEQAHKKGRFVFIFSSCRWLYNGRCQKARIARENVLSGGLHYESFAQYDRHGDTDADGGNRRLWRNDFGIPIAGVRYFCGEIPHQNFKIGWTVRVRDRERYRRRDADLSRRCAWQSNALRVAGRAWGSLRIRMRGIFWENLFTISLFCGILIYYRVNWLHSADALRFLESLLNGKEIQVYTWNVPVAVFQKARWLTPVPRRRASASVAVGSVLRAKSVLRPLRPLKVSRSVVYTEGDIPLGEAFGNVWRYFWLSQGYGRVLTTSCRSRSGMLLKILQCLPHQRIIQL